MPTVSDLRRKAKKKNIKTLVLLLNRAGFGLEQELTPLSSWNTICAVYRKLIFMVHPDKNPGHAKTASALTKAFEDVKKTMDPCWDPVYNYIKPDEEIAPNQLEMESVTSVSNYIKMHNEKLQTLVESGNESSEEDASSSKDMFSEEAGSASQAQEAQASAASQADRKTGLPGFHGSQARGAGNCQSTPEKSNNSSENYKRRLCSESEDDSEIAAGQGQSIFQNSKDIKQEEQSQKEKKRRHQENDVLCSPPKVKRSRQESHDDSDLNDLDELEALFDQDGSQEIFPNSPEDDSGINTPHRSPVGSQAMPPTQPTPQKTDPPPIPEDFECFLSKASNTHSTVPCFFIFYSSCKRQAVMDKCKGIGQLTDSIITCRNDVYPEMVLHAIKFGTQHRLTKLVNALKELFNFSHCTVKAILTKKWEACVHKMRQTCTIVLDECKNPTPEQSEEYLTEEEKMFNCLLLNDYALKKNYTDVLTIIGNYDRLAVSPGQCLICVNAKGSDHTNPESHAFIHRTHHTNAKVFATQRDKKKLAANAVITVTAAQKLKNLETSRQEMWESKIKQIIQKLDSYDDITVDLYIAATCIIDILGGQMVYFLETIHRALITADPKQRYVILQGDYNTGKTTIAAALLDLFSGVSLNLNVPADKVTFELGRAINKTMVVFEDVKGKPLPQSGLTYGYGFQRLDDLRDFLDGTVPVGLEKKHQDKVDQIFPPGIITTNKYQIPPAVQVRAIRTFHFIERPSVKYLMNKYHVSTRYLSDPRAFVIAVIMSTFQIRESDDEFAFRYPFWFRHGDDPNLDAMIGRLETLLDDFGEYDQEITKVYERLGTPKPICTLTGKERAYNITPGTRWIRDREAERRRSDRWRLEKQQAEEEELRNREETARIHEAALKAQKERQESKERMERIRAERQQYFADLKAQQTRKAQSN